MKAIHFLAVLAVATASAAGAAHAQTPPMSQGEVLKVLPKAVLLKHGPIDNMAMGPMTMQFGVASAKLLKTIRKGDHVRFAVEQMNGQMEVTRIERAK